MSHPTLSLRGVREHNLRGFDLELPHGRIVAITGRSGSGKSSLAFDTIFREGERRYLATLSPRSRRLFGRLKRPRASSIDGVRPVIAVDQRVILQSPRSTVGTLSALGDELRLLLARFGEQRCPACARPRPAREGSRGLGHPCACGRSLPALTRALLSFNTPAGACPKCRGLGLEDHVDPELLVADAKKSLREGALVPTTPNGYIVYSQVTPEVLNELCQAHGFDIDTPWQALDDEQREVIFYGSRRLQVPFGKHPLESRMKWSGIKAKPRELGYYRGIARVIEETLEKKRNDNVLRFVRSVPCSACAGSRLNEDARAVRLDGLDMAQWNALDLVGLPERLEFALGQAARAHPAQAPPRQKGKADEARLHLARPIAERIAARCRRFARLGLSHLQLSRPAASLSGGEARRLHLGTQLGCELSGLAFVFDEPGAGAHVCERERLADILDELRERDCSVFLVEHDPIFQSRADHVVEIGPGAGRAGGALLYSGPPRDSDRTLEALAWNEDAPDAPKKAEFIELRGARGHNLKNLDVRFLRGGFNVVCGVSGSGKTTLVETTLARALEHALAPTRGARARPAEHDELLGIEGLTRLVLVDQKEIGRSSRSNPATYSGAFDRIRTLFAETDAARQASFDKGRFSFNNEGGRCPRCEGAGVETIGLMNLPGIEQSCSLCNGRRFDPLTLAVTLHGLSIRDVLARTIEEALELFAEDEKLVRILGTLDSVGLGYLQLGQGVPTLSGGEAQRLKLAKELARTTDGCVLVLDEPTSGLHPRDIDVLHAALRALLDKGVTIVAVEHDPQLIARADWVIDLGPHSGPNGGELLAEGPPALIAKNPASETARVLRERRTRTTLAPRAGGRNTAPPLLQLEGVRTRNLRGVSLSLDPGRVHVVTGLSGSGKSALVFDTLASEGRRLFAESFSPYLRRELLAGRRAELERASGLRPTIAIQSRAGRRAAGDTRSTVGTFSELDDPLRLLFARLARLGGDDLDWTASHFSFNHVLGACEGCDGRGIEEIGDIERVIEDPTNSILAGALESTRGGRFLFERDGRHMAVLRAAAGALGHDLEPAWEALEPPVRAFVAGGSGERSFDVAWEHAEKRGESAHRFDATWPGVERLVAEEYEKKRERKLGPALKELLRETECRACHGERLQAKAASVRVAGMRLPELRAMSLVKLMESFENLEKDLGGLAHEVFLEIRAAARPTLERLLEIGLGHLSLERPTYTLSNGERRRLAIAKQLVSGLRDVCYVLDEPCLGLHAEDRARLATTLRALATSGNTVCCVEHDLDFIRACDRIHDIGPGAGTEGGRVVAVGTAEEIAAEPASWTGRFLSGQVRLRRSARAEPAQQVAGPRLLGANRHNLAGIDLSIELGQILCVCGVSGSGKSTLVLEVLAESLAQGRPMGCAQLQGAERIRELVRADAAFEGAGPGSLVATALELLDPLRTLFAKTTDARERGLTRSAFSPTSVKGRCPDCRGSGEHRIAFDFLPDAAEICRTCKGARYCAEVRQCRFEGSSIDEWLALPLTELAERLSGHADFRSTLERTLAIGLGHLSLGRRFDSLSHGERQRLALVRELGHESRASGPKLFVFDEPAAGLHAHDQRLLLALFEQLALAGHGVVFTEHALGLIRCADRVLELGPSAAEAGGRIVFDGSPAELERAKTPTGRALRSTTA